MSEENLELQTNDYDYVEEPEVEEENTTPEDNTEGEATENNQEEVNESFLNVKYNKEDKSLTREEAQLYAQKGMNYDKVHDKLSSYESAINTLAGMQGMTADQWLEQAAEAQKEKQKQDIMMQGVPEELVDDFIFAREERERQTAQKEEQNRLDKIASEFDALNDYLGEKINVDDIPDEVIEVWQSGVPLKYAYMEYERPMLKEKMEQEILSNLDKRKNSSTGTINTNNAITNNNDSDSVAAIENMSDEEFARKFLS